MPISLLLREAVRLLVQTPVKVHAACCPIVFT